jgi:hypothetical protein
MTFASKNLGSSCVWKGRPRWSTLDKILDQAWHELHYEEDPGILGDTPHSLFMLIHAPKQTDSPAYPVLYLPVK